MNSRRANGGRPSNTIQGFRRIKKNTRVTNRGAGKTMKTNQRKENETNPPITKLTMIIANRHRQLLEAISNQDQRTSIESGKLTRKGRDLISRVDAKKF